MTRRDNEHIDKITRALAEAHRARQEPSLGADWRCQVMRDIRLQAAGPGPSMTALGLDRVVWRTATVAAVLSLVFTGSVLLYTKRDAVEFTASLSNEVDVVVSLGE